MTGPIPSDTVTVPGGEERDEDWLTRAEASTYLRRFGVRMKPSTLARALCVGADAPPCERIRNRAFYRRDLLRAWAETQRERPRPGRRRSVWSSP
ncbi:hypothetical protein ACETK8_14670 [Brevundimonas staleyi]|uniref:DNA-binding protein n=1 Tax=Brevundimonas staleyi TaxID=74326 RepID=A0ABW0FUW6_9CAUL